MQSSSEFSPPLCGLADAICRVARQPSEPPPDPCQGVFDELPQHRPSRWLLSFLPALRALANWTDDGPPPAPKDWLRLEPRLHLRPRESLWPFDLDQIWLERVESMSDHCCSTGAAPATLVARWAPYEAAALAHVEACEQRTAAMADAATMLRAHGMRQESPLMFGRDTRTGRLSDVPRALLFDETMVFTTDRLAQLRDGELLFSGGVRTAKAEVVAVRVAAADIDDIMGEWAHSAAPAPPSLASTCRRAAIALFPGGPPSGMTATKREDLIADRVFEMCGRRPQPRTIREGLRGLPWYGARRRPT